MRYILPAFLALVAVLLLVLPPAMADDVHRPMQGSGVQNSPDSDNSNPRSDAAITAEVKMKLAREEGLKSLKIHVNTENGVVTLTGDVPGAAQKQAAMRVAESVDGVSSVRNALRVTNSRSSNTDQTVQQGKEKARELGNKAEQAGKELEQKAGDAAITAEVKLKLEKDDQLRASSINVDTTDSVVTLNGQVPDASQEQRAVALARSVAKVRSVRSNLKIERQDR